jgi:hypothetical protein
MTVGFPRLPLWVDPLIAEAKRRARHRRLVLGSVLLAAVVAGLALTLGLPGGSSGGGGSAGFNNGSLSGSRASANQARLERGGPVKLLPGRVSTGALGMKASFEVFHHWYGEQKPGLLRLAKYLSTGGYEVGLSSGGIEVETLDSPLAQSARRLESLPGIRVHHVSSIRIGGHPGRRYRLSSNHLFELHPGDNIGTGEQDVILLGVGHGTLVIKNMDAVVPKLIPDHDQERREAERVIQSFKFRS